jgi:adenine-specific DNA-methyltransferase
LRAQIRAGDDPLGDFFSSVRSQETRRSHGATYTPRTIVDAMIAGAALESPAPQRIVDPAVAAAVFLSLPRRPSRKLN